MGGGDLNLKKSWHPSTLRNIERVWKAEQKHEVEKQKIEQLQKELAEERAREEIQAFAEDQGVVKKREERLDWMYQGPAAMVNREDYLLGRKVDKTLELLEQEESGVAPKNDEFDIGSSMFSSQDLSGTATVDLANKIREDPLFSIMKKEKEQRKNLLSNPVKMKQLQQMLQQSLSKGKKKKSKKRHSDSDTDERHHKKRHSDSDIDEKPHKKRHTDNSTERHHKKRHSDSDTTEKLYRKYKKSKNHKKHSSDYEEISTRKEYKIKKIKEMYSDEDKSYHRKTYQNTPNYSSRDREHRLSPKHVRRSHYSEPYAKSQMIKDRSSENENRRKMTDEERELRLKEMQENARWREEQCERKVKRYREDDEREEKERAVAPHFIKPLLKAAGKGSLENRVKQKIFSIQRNSADMNKHFARR